MYKYSETMFTYIVACIIDCKVFAHDCICSILIKAVLLL